jgi:hypothetical protein
MLVRMELERQSVVEIEVKTKWPGMTALISEEKNGSNGIIIAAKHKSVPTVSALHTCS